MAEAYRCLDDHEGGAMATCNTCHRDAGWLKHECDDCRQRREAAEAAKAATERAAAEQARLARIDAMVDEAVSKLELAVAAGGTVVLVDLAVIPLDEDQISRAGLDQLRDLGARGWSIATSSPVLKTSTNMEFALSSLELGQLQVLVQLAITSANVRALEPEIRNHYAARAAAEVGEQP